MSPVVSTILGVFAKALVPFVSAYAGYQAGQDNKENERLRDENAALRKELERVNSRPVTDSDINRMLNDWKESAKD